MHKQVDAIIEDKQGQPLLLLADFNGHFAFLGKQKLDEGGKIILSLMEDHNLVLVNSDLNCQGLYTWEGREHNSVADYALLNSYLFQKYVNMFTDEEKEIFDLADHNLMIIRFKKAEVLKTSIAKVQEVVHFKRDDESLKGFARKVEEACCVEENIGIEKLQ